MTHIRVLLVDDHAVLRESLRAFLEMYPDLEVVGEAADGLEAVAQARQCQPDVVLLDVAMPGLGGPEVTRRLKQDHPDTRVLILTQYSGADYVLHCLRAGADGYVVKKAGGAEVVRAVRAVYEGQGYLHPSVARVVIEAAAQGQKSGGEPPHERLTDREREVLSLIGQGLTNQEIAQTLSLSVKTVDKYRARLMEKLGVSTRAGLIRYALEKRLVPLDEPPA